MPAVNELENGRGQWLRPGDCVLEVAPGPGYLSIELARPGTYRIAGIDVSRTFVRPHKMDLRAASCLILALNSRCWQRRHPETNGPCRPPV
jgi:2-polyprenyl-3-methyl-5-hydroxy-6-metoxy-1,4-benzoquinol methylase